MAGSCRSVMQAWWLVLAMTGYYIEVHTSPMPPASPPWAEDYIFKDYEDQACVVDTGVTYPAGSPVPSDQPCQTCTCESGPLGALIVCDSSSCDASLDEHMFQEQTCTMENGAVYGAGAEVPSANPCQTCTCEAGPMGALVVCVNGNPNCGVEPTKDYSSQNCTLRSGEVYPAGSAVPPTDPCQSCRCESAPLGALVVCMSRDCGIPSCADAVRVAGSCCPICPNGPSCYFGDALLRPVDGEREMMSLNDGCGVWCQCDTSGDLTCALHCTQK